MECRLYFSFAGTVIASVVVSFPLMYRTARSAFEQMDQNLVYAGQTLGLSNYTIFWKVIFPNCFPGIAGGNDSGICKSSRRIWRNNHACGNIPGKTQTVAIAVYSAMQNGNRTQAYQWVGGYHADFFFVNLAYESCKQTADEICN